MANLNVSFDLWKGESDAQPYIPDMVQKMKDNGFAYISDQGALVVDVKGRDRHERNSALYDPEIRRCFSVYNTTDLATIVERMKTVPPGRDHLRGRQASGVIFHHRYSAVQEKQVS